MDWNGVSWNGKVFQRNKKKIEYINSYTHIKWMETLLRAVVPGLAASHQCL